MSAEFNLTARDYRLDIEVVCTACDDVYPNQAHLRDAVNKLIFELQNWEGVHVSIKTVEDE